MNIPIQTINHWQRHYNTISPQERGLLEYWLFLNKPAKRYEAIVDLVLGIGYCPESLEIVGEIDTFNCKAQHCYMYGVNGYLYYGYYQIDDKERLEGVARLVINRRQWKSLR